MIEVVERAEETIVRELNLEPLAIPSEFAAARGSWRGTDVAVTSRAYSGRGITRARFVYVRGDELEIGNALCLAADDVAVPILGIEVLRHRTGQDERRLVVADLSPVDSAPSAAHSHPDLPAWCAGIFSPDALCERPDDASLPVVLEAVARMTARFTALFVNPSPASPAIVRAARERYLTAHRANGPERAMLANIFGAEWATAFIDHVLFPTRLP